MDEREMQKLAARLEEAGLTNEVFDVEEIAVDLAERSEMNETLEPMVEGDRSAPTPATFEPRWDR